jgi:hypothetical protein
MGFLDYLAGMALGAKPAAAARPSLPSRFASSAIGGWEQRFDAAEEAGPATNGARDRQAPDHGTAWMETPVAFTQARNGQALEKSPLRALPLRAEAHASEFPSNREGLARPLPSQLLIDSADEAPPVTGLSLPIANRSAVPSQPTPTAISRPTPPPRMPLEVPPARLVTRAAPLTDAAVAGRTMSVREEGPVIHVTVDRLDVRAAVPAKAAAEPQRARPLPAVSLSDYLRGGQP